MLNKIVQKSAEIIYKFDLFSKPTEIPIGGMDSSRSCVGAFISIVCITLTLILTKPTIEDFIYVKNPKVTSNIEYDTKFLNVTSKNFGLSISFFSQLRDQKAEISNVTNNYTDLIGVSDVNMQCNTCNFSINNTYYDKIYGTTNKTRVQGKRHIQGNNVNIGWNKDRAFLDKSLLPNFSKKNISSGNFSLEFCKPSRFDGIRIRSLSEIKAFDIASIMKTFSLCLPEVFQLRLDDGSKSKFEDNIKGFTEYSKPKVIPSSLRNTFTVNGAIDPTTKKKPMSIYNVDYDKLDNLLGYKDVVALSSESNDLKNIGDFSDSIKNNEDLYQDLKQDILQEMNNQENIINDQYNQQNPNEGGQNTNWNGGENTNENGDENTNGNGDDNTNGAGNDNINENGDDNTNENGDENTNGAGDDNTNENGDENTNGTGEDNANGTGEDNANGTGDDNGGGEEDPNNRLLKSHQRKKLRNMQTTNTKTTSANTKTTTNFTIPDNLVTNTTLIELLKENSLKNSYPKVIFLSKNLQITPQKGNLLTIVYDMNIMNYYNEITGIPMSYNIFVQNITVIIKTTKFLIPIEETKTELIVKLIEENKLDVSNRKSISFNFKVYSDTLIINVSYTSFEDVLGAFGGFFSTFSLLAMVLSELFYNDFFYKLNTINSVFRFTKGFTVSNDVHRKINNFESINIHPSNMQNNLRKESTGTYKSDNILVEDQGNIDNLKLKENKENNDDIKTYNNYIDINSKNDLLKIDILNMKNPVNSYETEPKHFTREDNDNIYKLDLAKLNSDISKNQKRLTLKNIKLNNETEKLHFFDVNKSYHEFNKINVIELFKENICCCIATDKRSLLIEKNLQTYRRKT